jgi:hypothetical protein
LAQQADDALFRGLAASSHSFDILETEWKTLNTIPVTCSSHNAHGHPVLVQSAISSGCMTFEMTLFPAGNDLLIGPNPEILSRELNLRSLYIDPLLRILRDHNEKEDKLLGVSATGYTQTLVLLMNFDADPERAWSSLLPHLDPLREAGFLTYFNGSSLVQGPLTIVATGNVPFHRILERSTSRDVFYDAPLLQLSPLSSEGLPRSSEFNIQNTYYASADFRKAIGNVDFNGFSENQLSKLRQQIQMAHEVGFKVRYWGTPTQSRELRNYVWRILAREGADIITVDESSHPHRANLG